MADLTLDGSKPCSKCGVVKPNTSDYFTAYRNGKQTGLRHVCRLCRGLKSEGPSRLKPSQKRGTLTEEERRERNRLRCRDYYRRNKDKILAGFREARKADPEKHRERDRCYYQKNKAARSDYAKRRWANANKEERREQLREWRAANPEKVKAIERRRADKINSDPELRAKRNARVSAWQKKNLDKGRARQERFRRANPEAVTRSHRRYCEKNPHKRREKDKRWREQNRDKVLAQSEKRRVRVKAAEGEFTDRDVRALLKKYGNVCFYCGEKTDQYQIDHFIPLSRGGSNWPSNLVIACRSCNLKKGAKMPWDWMPHRFAESKTSKEG